MYAYANFYIFSIYCDQSSCHIYIYIYIYLFVLLSQQIFGYKPIPKESTKGSQEIATDRENAAALVKALYTAIDIPMTICCSIYSFLYFTYPRECKVFS